MIKKLSLQKIVYILTIIVIIALPLIRLTTYNLFVAGVTDDPYAKWQVYILWGAIPLWVITYVYGLVMGKFKFKSTDIIIYILIITAFISTYVAVDTHKSIIGEYHREEGLLSIISYYLLFLNVKNIDKEKYKKGIIIAFIAVGVLQSIYAILQVYTQFEFIRHSSIPYMAMGLNGNPNFFGSYMVMLSLLTSLLYLTKKEKKYLFLAILFFGSICLASSTGPFLGFVIALIFLLIVFYKQMKLKEILILLLSLMAIYFMVDKSVRFVQENQFKQTIDTSYNITSELSQTLVNYKNGNIGNGRLQLWSSCIPIVEKYWLLGAGLDNFALVMPRTGYLIFDKAHNVYLQMLITNGIFALTTYCILCLIIFIKGFKFKEPISIALFGAFVGYSIQAFSNISVIDVAPLFFIVLGLLYTYNKSEQQSRK